MDTVAHFTAGYFLTRTLIRLEDDPDIVKNQKMWLSFGVFCAQLPDIDELLGCLINKEKRQKQFSIGSSHHEEITHLPALYLGVFGVGLVLINSLRNKTLKFAYKVFVANITAHLVMDSFGMGKGLRWLYPFKDKLMGVGLTNKYGPEDWKEFYFSKKVIYELIVYFLAAFEVFSSRKKPSFK